MAMRRVMDVVSVPATLFVSALHCRGIVIQCRSLSQQKKKKKKKKKDCEGDAHIKVIHS